MVGSMLPVPRLEFNASILIAEKSMDLCDNRGVGVPGRDKVRFAPGSGLRKALPPSRRPKPSNRCSPEGLDVNAKGGTTAEVEEEEEGIEEEVVMDKDEGPGTKGARGDRPLPPPPPRGDRPGASDEVIVCGGGIA